MPLSGRDSRSCWLFRLSRSSRSEIRYNDLRKVTEGDGRSRKITEGGGRSRKVTQGHGRSRKVTEGHERSAGVVTVGPSAPPPRWGAAKCCERVIAIDRPIEDAEGDKALAAQCADEGQASATQAAALRAPSAQGRHIGLDPGFVDEDKPLRVTMRLKRAPPLAPPPDVGTGLLEPEQLFFSNRAPRPAGTATPCYARP